MKFILGLVFSAFAAHALAQAGSIGAVKIEPNPAQAGKEVKITITADGDAPSFCGMVVHFDDGSESRQIKIDGNENKFPVSFTKTFAKPGSYSIKAEGRKITTHFPCVGAATTKLVVEGAPAAKSAAPACPEGWKMKGKPGKGGDFTCTAGKGVAMPKEPVACGTGLDAYANEKARQVGCRKPAKKK